MKIAHSDRRVGCADSQGASEERLVHQHVRPAVALKLRARDDSQPEVPRVEARLLRARVAPHAPHARLRQLPQRVPKQRAADAALLQARAHAELAELRLLAISVGQTGRLAVASMAHPA